MIGTDLLQVLYSPRKAFKRIIENPKYLGAIIVVVLFIGLQIGFEYIQFSQTYTEQTQPQINYLSDYTNASSGYWISGSNVNITNNFNDYFNYTIYTAYGYYPNLFGNNSLQISGVNTNNVQAALTNIFSRNLNDGSIATSSADCSEVGFQNISMTVKMVEPQSAPKNATLTLYSLSDTNYYQYDLTSSLSNLASGQWSNLTIPVGKSASGWKTIGSPSWTNITSLTLGANYPENSNVTIRVGALFFRGQYQTPIQQDANGVLLNFLQRFSLQILFSWFLITGLIYLLLKLIKTNINWKPLFIATGFALLVMVIRALVNIIATLTLPALYYTFDLLPGVGLTPWGTTFYSSQAAGTLFAESQAAITNIGALSSTFNLATAGIFILSYVWLGALASLILAAMIPELSTPKRTAISAVSIIATVLVLIFFVVGVA